MTDRQFIDMPDRIARLPRDPRGFPVPKFVHWFDNGPDFRILSPEHLAACVKRDLCWICGDRLGAYKCFVIGPMCAISKISAEPPSHRECAVFAAKNCPFLTTPLARRREKNLPENRYVPGTMLERNPGVTAVWITRGYRTFRPHNGGILFEVGEPLEVVFYAEGRFATRVEVDRSVASGMPFLIEEANRNGGDAIIDLGRQRRRFEQLLERLLPLEGARR